MKNKSTSPIRKSSIILPFCILLIVSLLFRILLFFYYPQKIATEYDSVTYALHAKDVLNDSGIIGFFNPFRPPVYVGTVVLGYLFTGEHHNPNTYESLLGRTGSTIVLLQSFFGLLSTMLLFLILKKFFQPWLAFLFTLFFALNPLIIVWEHIILSESIGINLIILLFYSYLIFLEKPNFVKLLFVSAATILAFYLRTTFIIFFPFLLFIYLYKYRSKQSILFSFIGGSIVLMSLFLHLQVNKQRFNVSTIQVMSYINVYGRIIQNNYKNPSLPNNKVAMDYETFRNPNVIFEQRNPWDYLAYIDAVFYFNPEIVKDIKEFNRKTIEQNKIIYMRDAIRDIPKIFEVYPMIIPPQKLKFTEYLLLLYSRMNIVLLVSCLFFPYYFFMFFLKRNNKLFTYIFLFGISGILYLIVTALFSYQEYSRIGSASIPIIYIYVCLICADLLRRLGKDK